MLALSELLKGSDYPMCNLGVKSAVGHDRAFQAMKLSLVYCRTY